MIILATNNKPLLIGRAPILTSAAVAPTEPPVPGVDLPTASIAGHWDVSAMPAGEAYLLTDQSGAGKNATVQIQGGNSKVLPRVAGMLPGLYAEGNASNYSVRQPVVLGYKVNAPSIPVGAGGKMFVWLVWSRPNLSQPDSTNFSNSPVKLLEIDGVTVLQLGAAGAGADALTLFPAGAALQAGSMTLRHTRGIGVQIDGSTITIILDDGTVLFNAVANTLSLGSTATLNFLTNAGMIFHDAGAYSKVLDSTELAAWRGYITRWSLGPRFAAHPFMVGQSNAGIFAGNTPLLSKTLMYMSGCLSCNLLSGGYNLPNPTLFSGTPLYDNSGNLVLNSAGGGDPSTWPMGANGNTLMATIDAMTADDRDSVNVIFWFWSESLSSVLTYAKKAEVKAAHIRAWSLIRAKFGRTAAQLPVVLIDPLPFPTNEGAQTMREAFADMIADSTVHASMMLATSQDGIGQGDSWDPATGIESGPGNNSHRDDPDMTTFSRRLAIPTTRALHAGLAARGRVEPLASIDSSWPVTGGPQVMSAVLEQAGTVLVTLLHDGGNDLIVPLRAAAGAGWFIMDGVSDTVAGTPAAPGNMIPMTACVRVDATHLRFTPASQPVHAPRAKLFCGYGTGLTADQKYALIGRGNAVTDNFSTLTLTNGWRIKDALGAPAQPNYPVQTTQFGVQLI